MKAGESKELSCEIAELPSRIEVERMAYHFFSRGEEIATNQSDQRRILNEEETYDYLLHQYLTVSQGKSRGPSLFKPIKKTDLSSFVGNDALPTVIVSVLIDEQGKVSQADVQSGLTEWQDEVCQLVKQVRFFPSLKEGQPVELRIKLRLAQIAQ